jgi:hypothetical protein
MRFLFCAATLKNRNGHRELDPENDERQSIAGGEF